MIFRGKLKSLTPSSEDSFDITFTLTNPQGLSLSDVSGDLDITIDKHRDPRSMAANSLFHVLVGKIAKAQTPPISFTRAKNELLADYGCEQFDADGNIIVIESTIPPEKMMENDSIHLRVLENDGDIWHYQIMRGTHSYNSKEMSALIDGAMEECRQMGIQV